MCSQLTQEVVNASLRTPLHRSDNADVKLSSAFFAHSLRFTSRRRCPTSRTDHPGWQQPLTVKFLLGVVSKICALHGRPLFRITAGMYLARDRRSVAGNVNFDRLPLNYDERGTGTSGRTPGVMEPAICQTQGRRQQL